MRKSSDEEVVI